jgi:hypothetical protein
MRMIMHYGFDESDDNLKCPGSLKQILLNSIKSHKRSLPELQNQGLHPFSHLSNAIPWKESVEINKYMHCVNTGHHIDFNLNGFGLQLSQGLYRQEAAGKTGLACLMNGEDGHSMVINLSGGKTDQTGVLGYGKRFACNWLEPHNCLPTAVGRNIFSRLSSNSSNYLYMTNEQAQRYETKLAAKKAMNDSKEEPVRVRALGPHTGFRIHFQRGVMNMDRSKPGRFGIPPSIVAPHVHKRNGYREVKRIPGVSQDHVNARADHQSGNVHVYGAKMVAGLFTSGGPPERIDFTMAKALANLPRRTLIFNQSPPHFTPEFIDTIPFDRIVPCYRHLPQKLVKLLPLLLAQLVHHYHSVDGLASLGSDNPLRLSPLWNDPSLIQYRFDLFDNLVGASYKSGTEPSQDLRDLDTDSYICEMLSMRNGAALLQASASLLEHQGLDASRVHDCLQETRTVYREVTGRPLDHVQMPAVVQMHPVNLPSKTGQLQIGLSLQPIVRSQPIVQGHQNSRPAGAFILLQQAPGPFVMPVALQCRFAFCRMHSKGNDRLGLWRGKNAAMIDKTIEGKERKRQRELFNKVLSVCKMILGSNSFAEVDKIGTDRAWVLCCDKVQHIWRFDLLLQGNAAIRSVDNIMHGKDTKLTAEECSKFVRQCQTSSWTCVSTDQTNVEDASVLNVSAEDDLEAPLTPSVKDISADLYAEDRTDDGTSDAHSQDDAVKDAKVCFVCDVCAPIRLFPQWAKYTEHAKKHKDEKFYFIRSEVKVVLASKSNKDSKTSSYCAIGNPYFRRYTAEETRVHLRQQILYRHILRSNDQIKLYYSLEQPSVLATVLDPEICCIQKEHKVKVLLLCNPRSVFQCPVSSILEIVVPPRSSITVAPARSPLTAQKANSPASVTGLSSQSKASARSKQVTVFKVPQRKLLFAASKLTFVGSTGAVASSPTAERATEWRPLCQSDLQLALGVNIMLRGVSEFQTWYAIPKLSGSSASMIGTTSSNIGFPVFKHKGASFVDSDYGMHFSSIYPPWIQSVLHAFNLDESYRCFYLALGIALNYDPFMLQCLFRSHSKFLSQNMGSILDVLQAEPDTDVSAAIRMELEELPNVSQLDKYFDCCLLRFFWPKEFENIRIVVIASRASRTFETVFHSATWSSTSSGAKTIYLKLESDHYTHLTLVRGTLIHEASAWLCHEVCPEMRCPPINTLAFDTAEDKESYLASALAGQIPTMDQVSTIWKQVTRNTGLEADQNSGKWVKGIPQGVSCKDHNQHGSLKAGSWEDVRDSLVSALYSKQPVNQRKRRGPLSPIKPSVRQASGRVPLVFLDVGSEAGTGLLKMLHDSRITHAAGIELQAAWFHHSVGLFKDLRREFVNQGYRMPQISLFRSCMMSTKPELAYIYASASIVWMNNPVFDREGYFKVTKPKKIIDEEGQDKDQHITQAPWPLRHLKANDPARSSLSANAACTFSNHFHHSTCIAVFAAEYFSEIFNYKHVKTLEVTATWGDRSGHDNSALHVTIMGHNQHAKIGIDFSLPCVSHLDACLWDQSMELWGNSLQNAYAALKHDKWHTLQNRSSGGKVDEDGKVWCDSDEEADLYSTLSRERALEVEALVSNRWSNPNISLQSAATLQKGHVLNTDTIVQYMRLLKQYFPRVSFCSTISGTCEQLLKLRRPKDYLRFAESYLPFDQCDQLIFTLNPGHHWIAFKIHLTEEYIASICSMNDPLTATAKQILTVLSSTVPRATFFKHISVPVPHQRNCTDCGPLCCMFMLFMAHSNVTTSTELHYETKTTALSMRMRIFTDLANDKLTPLEHYE